MSAEESRWKKVSFQQAQEALDSIGVRLKFKSRFVISQSNTIAFAEKGKTELLDFLEGIFGTLPLKLEVEKHMDSIRQKREISAALEQQMTDLKQKKLPLKKNREMWDQYKSQKHSYEKSVIK